RGWRGPAPAALPRSSRAAGPRRGAARSSGGPAPGAVPTRSPYAATDASQPDLRPQPALGRVARGHRLFPGGDAEKALLAAYHVADTDGAGGGDRPARPPAGPPPVLPGGDPRRP